MTEQAEQAHELPGAVATEPPPPTSAGKGTRIASLLVLGLLVGSLLWYFVADRLTPYTAQARVQAFVVPLAAEVPGKVLKVHVRNNDEVQQGAPLFDIDPSQYRIALQKARSDYESVRRSVNAASATVEAARASLQAAKANHLKAEKDAIRQETLYAEDPGAISVRRLEGAQATRVMEAIFAEHAGRGFGRAQMLRALGLQLLTLTARVAMEAGEGEGEGNAPSRQAELLARFGDLLESHFRDHWGVEDYARALAITPTHLTRLARGATGRPASRLIEERLVREARRNLVFTNLPVTAIAYDLGFADPAYFSRVFARVTGVSPSGFRERAGV